MGRLSTIHRAVCLLTFVEHALSQLNVLRPPGAFYNPLVPLTRLNSPDIQLGYGNVQPSTKYGITRQFLPMSAINRIMQPSNYLQESIPIASNQNLMPVSNYPTPIHKLQAIGNNPFRIPNYVIQIQKFPFPMIPNFPISNLNLPTYIPYPMLVNQQQIESNEVNPHEQDSTKTGNLEEDNTESSEDTVILNSPVNATAAADEKKDAAIDQTKGIVGDIISFIPFLPIEINVPDVIGGIVGGIGWIFNGIGGWIPFINRPASSTSSRLSFALGPDGAPVIVPVNYDGLETAIDNDVFLY